jgi:hypothetical protein
MATSASCNMLDILTHTAKKATVKDCQVAPLLHVGAYS